MTKLKYYLFALRWLWLNRDWADTRQKYRTMNRDWEAKGGDKR